MLYDRVTAVLSGQSRNVADRGSVVGAPDSSDLLRSLLRGVFPRGGRFAAPEPARSGEKPGMRWRRRNGGSAPAFPRWWPLSRRRTGQERGEAAQGPGLPRLRPLLCAGTGRERGKAGDGVAATRAALLRL